MQLATKATQMLEQAKKSQVEAREVRDRETCLCKFRKAEARDEARDYVKGQEGRYATRGGNTATVGRLLGH